MCDHGVTVPVTVVIPADLSYTGEQRVDVKRVDSCIAPIVRALVQAGIVTRGSCCGHGIGDGEILLQDGRKLVVRTP